MIFNYQGDPLNNDILNRINFIDSLNLAKAYIKNERHNQPGLCKKYQIVRFNKANNIKFIDDPSNFNEKFTRIMIRNYLIKTNQANIIKKDFNIISSYIHLYKKMINEILHQILIKIKKNNIVVSLKNFKNFDEVLKEKIIEKIFYYFQTKNKKLRYSKVKIFLNELNKNNLKCISISNIIVVKSQNSLDFSINK